MSKMHLQKLSDDIDTLRSRMDGLIKRYSQSEDIKLVEDLERLIERASEYLRNDQPANAFEMLRRLRGKLKLFFAGAVKLDIEQGLYRKNPRAVYTGSDKMEPINTIQFEVWLIPNGVEASEPYQGPEGWDIHERGSE